MILCDTGPLVNLVDTRQSSHAVTDAFFDRLNETPITTLACLNEAFYLLCKLRGWSTADLLFQLVEEGALKLAPIVADDLPRMRQLLSTYRSLPMDFADATLVVVAERLSIKRVITIDSDFFVYRLADGSALEVLNPG